MYHVGLVAVKNTDENDALCPPGTHNLGEERKQTKPCETHNRGTRQGTVKELWDGETRSHPKRVYLQFPGRDKHSNRVNTP